MSVPLLIGGLVGAFAASKMFKPAKQQTSGYVAPIATMQNVSAAPAAPNASATGDGETEAQKAMREAAEKQAAEAAQRRKNNQNIFTSPLGATGTANLYQKQLLGASA